MQNQFFFFNILGLFQNKDDWLNFYTQFFVSQKYFFEKKKQFSGGNHYPRLDFPHVAVKFSEFWTLVGLYWLSSMEEKIVVMFLLTKFFFGQMKSGSCPYHN